METITITVKEYERLQKRDDTLSFLEALGVDNWQGYRLPPDREDYDTDAEYEVAYEKSLYDN